MRLTIFLLLIAIVITVLIFFPHIGQNFGLSENEFGRLSRLTILLLALSSMVGLRHTKITEIIRNLLIWLIIIFILVVGYLLYTRNSGLFVIFFQ